MVKLLFQCCVIIQIFCLIAAQSNVSEPGNFRKSLDNIVLVIEPELFEAIWNIDTPPKCPETNSTDIFLCAFTNYFIHYDKALKIPTKTFQKIAEFNELNKNPVNIWLSYAPKNQISNDLDAVIELIRRANSQGKPIVSDFILEYLYQEPNDQAMKLVNEDVKIASKKFIDAQMPNVSVGLTFDVGKCAKSGTFFSHLDFEQLSVILFMPREPPKPTLSLDVSVPITKNTPCYLLASSNATSHGYNYPIFIQVESKRANLEGSFDYDKPLENAIDLIKTSHNTHIKSGDKQLMVMYAQLSNNSIEFTKLSKEQAWLRRPLEFRRDHFGVTVHPQEIHLNVSQLVTKLLQTFRKIIVVADDSGGDVLVEELAKEKLASVRGTSVRKNSLEATIGDISSLQIMLQVNAIGMNSMELEALIRKMGDLSKLGNSIYGGIVDSVLFNTFGINQKKLLESPNLCDELKRIAGTSKQILKTARSTFPSSSYRPGVDLGLAMDGTIFRKLAKCDLNLRNELIKSLNFVSCEFSLPLTKIATGAEKQHKSLVDKMIQCWPIRRAHFKKLIFFLSIQGCPSNYKNSTELVEFVQFWKLVNEWAIAENATVYMNTAFEWDKENGICGWWRVRPSGKPESPNPYLLQDKQSLAVEMLESTSSGRTPGSENSSELVIILVPSILSILILSTVAILLLLYYRSKYLLSQEETTNFFKGNRSAKKNKSGGGGEEKAKEDGCESAENMPYNKEKYEISTSAYTIDDNRILGSGEFGSVYFSSIRRGEISTNVAVKMPKHGGNRQAQGFYLALKGLMSEIKILSYLGTHQHVINLEGAHTSKLRCGEILVFLELCQLGSLEKYLRSYQPQEIEDDELVTDLSNDMSTNEKYVNTMTGIRKLDAGLAQDLMRWAKEIAGGLEFISLKRIVHADVATRNVLLNSRKIAKISDFGLSRKLYDYTSYVKKNQEPLPWRWMSPESLRRLVFNEKTDVWSFGIVLWELFTLGDVPYPGMSWDVNFPTMLENGLKPHSPRYNENEVYSLMLRCWNVQPVFRPSFAELRLLLSQSTKGKPVDWKGSVSANNENRYENV